MVKQTTFCATYVKSKCGKFKSIQLKFKMHTGVSGIGKNLYHQKRGPDWCKTCNELKTLRHFIFHCTAYDVQRQILFNDLKASCNENVFSLLIKNHGFA